MNQWQLLSSRTVFTVKKLPLCASSFNPLQSHAQAGTTWWFNVCNQENHVEVLHPPCSPGPGQPQQQLLAYLVLYLTFGLARQSSCTEGGVSPDLLLSLWWERQQQLLSGFVVHMFASARKSIFLLEVLFLPKQPFFMISREIVWAGLKLLLASFSCIMLFYRICPVKSASIAVLQDLYYMCYTPSSLENIQWRNLLFQFQLQN